MEELHPCNHSGLITTPSLTRANIPVLEGLSEQASGELRSIQSLTI